MSVYEQVKQALQDIVAPELRAIQGEIKCLDERINSLKTELTTEIKRLDEKIDSLDEKLDTKLDSIDDRLNTKTTPSKIKSIPLLKYVNALQHLKLNSLTAKPYSPFLIPIQSPL